MEIFNLLVPSRNDRSGQCWARPKPGARGPLPQGWHPTLLSQASAEGWLHVE